MRKTAGGTDCRGESEDQRGKGAAEGRPTITKEAIVLSQEQGWVSSVLISLLSRTENFLLIICHEWDILRKYKG